jgi:hypothetical protein
MLSFSISYPDLIKFTYFAGTRLYLDLIKFHYFADTTEGGDMGPKAEEIGGESRG